MADLATRRGVSLPGAAGIARSADAGTTAGIAVREVNAVLDVVAGLLPPNPNPNPNPNTSPNPNPNPKPKPNPNPTQVAGLLPPPPGSSRRAALVGLLGRACGLEVKWL